MYIQFGKIPFTTYWHISIFYLFYSQHLNPNIILVSVMFTSCWNHLAITILMKIFYLNAQTLTPSGLRMNSDPNSMTLHRVFAIWLSVLFCEMWIIIIIIIFNSLMLPGLNEFIHLTCLRQCLAYNKRNMTNIYFIAFILSLFFVYFFI